ncbi:MAG: PepSY domain-containing protein [Pseudomonadota bacterium]
MKLRFGLVAASLVLVSGAAFAKKSCTDQPKDKWMTEEAFKAKVEGEGYKISKFKKPGTCYEIYGTDKDGKKVEIYFNPVDGTPVKHK